MNRGTQTFTFNYVQFLKDQFQTTGRMLAFFDSYNVRKPGEAAVAKWFQRGSVPSEWFAVIVAMLELENGKPVCLSPYLDRGQ